MEQQQAEPGFAQQAFCLEAAAVFWWQSASAGPHAVITNSARARRAIAVGILVGIVCLPFNLI